MKMKKKTVHIISLGCAKNTVDSDSMGQLLNRASYEIIEQPEQAEYIIVNTCGFIDSAKDESYRVLKDIATTKSKNQKLIAAGCLTQRYGKEVIQRVPEIDGVLGTRRWMDIVDIVQLIRSNRTPKPVYHLPETPTVGTDEKEVLRASIMGNSAYLKIADGCRRPCSYCAIPAIKGTTVSRPIETIIKEAVSLQEMGIRELILISQDTTDYGYDLGIKDGLASLLSELVQNAPDIDWIRIMYAYPGYITDQLIEVMATNPQILPYLDIPLQHAHPDILKSMRRPSNIEWTYQTIEKMRNAMPDLAIRSTFIVGYPGETEVEFNTLLDFIQAIRFDRVGVFPFSSEPGTRCEKLGDPIPLEIKKQRIETLMEYQQQISLEINQKIIGEELEVLIEGYGDGISLGRSYRDAPEVDGMVIIEKKLSVGDMVPIQIIGAMPYDLFGITYENIVE
jgi:ribosomal protein S12 methylthiotransferase